MQEPIALNVFLHEYFGVKCDTLPLNDGTRAIFVRAIEGQHWLRISVMIDFYEYLYSKGYPIDRRYYLKPLIRVHPLYDAYIATKNTMLLDESTPNGMANNLLHLFAYCTTANAYLQVIASLFCIGHVKGKQKDKRILIQDDKGKVRLNKKSAVSLAIGIAFLEYLKLMIAKDKVLLSYDPKDYTVYVVDMPSSSTYFSMVNIP